MITSTRGTLRSLNRAWRSKHPQQGHFTLARFSDRSWGWTFKPKAPVLDNFVETRPGFETSTDALEDLKRYVRERT